MKITFDQRLISSFLLFLDHNILEKGEAFENYSGLFYPISSNVSGRYAYAAPFKQMVNDTAITNANVISGIYLNGTLVNIGASGYTGFNHLQGAAYFTGELPLSTVISGNYSIKEFNVQYTNEVEQKLLFETKYVTNSRFSQSLSGLSLDTKTSPAIFLRVKNLENRPFGLGGIDDNNIQLRAVIIADTDFQKIGVCNIIKNLNYKEFFLVNSTPFDQFGTYTGIPYNYDNLNFDRTGYFPMVETVRIIDVPMKGEYQNISKSMAIADITLQTIMRHE